MKFIYLFTESSVFVFQNHSFCAPLGPQRAFGFQSGQRWGWGSTEKGSQGTIFGEPEEGIGGRGGFLEQQALAGFSQGRGMPAPSSCIIPLYSFTHSIRLIREWFWASLNTCLGPPTSTIPRTRTTQKPASITTTWNTSVQITAFMPPCRM